MANLQQLADLVGGQLEGDPDIEIHRLSPLETAQEGDIVFVANPKYLPKLLDCRASAVIVAPKMKTSGHNLLIVANPYLAFAKILTFLQVPERPCRGVMAGAQVADSAELAEGVTIYPNCVVGENVKIGAGTTLYPGVVVYDDVRIGCDCILHAGAVVRERCSLGDRVILQPAAMIGADGFGFAPDGSGYYKIPQVGTVELEDDVEIGACSCVDRATLEVTRIRRGTKIDNLVQIGHNVEIGEDGIFCAQVGIAGSVKLGRHCTFGGQAAVAGHVKVADNVTIGARGGVTNSVESNQVLSGLPLQPHKEWLKMSSTLPNLPQMRKDLHQLKKRIAELEAKLKED